MIPAATATAVQRRQRTSGPRPPAGRPAPTWRVRATRARTASLTRARGARPGVSAGPPALAPRPAAPPAFPRGARLLGADPVDGAPVRDGQRPARRAALRRVVPARRAPHLQQRLLRHLLGLGGIPQDPPTQPEDPGRQLVVERAEGRLIAAGDPAEQVSGLLVRYGRQRAPPFVA